MVHDFSKRSHSPLSTLLNLLKTSSAQCPRGIALHCMSYLSYFFYLFLALVVSGFWVHLSELARNAGGVAIGDVYDIIPILKMA